MDYGALVPVLVALEARHVQYAVFGAVALNVHGLARITEDLDLFVAPTAENIARLRDALNDVFNDPEIGNITETDLLGEYPSVRYVPPAGRFYLDILTRLGEMFTFDTLETERKAIDGLTVTVVTPRMLYRMKKGTVRLKDRADAEMVRRRFNLREE